MKKVTFLVFDDTSYDYCVMRFTRSLDELKPMFHGVEIGGILNDDKNPNIHYMREG